MRILYFRMHQNATKFKVDLWYRKTTHQKIAKTILALLREKRTFQLRLLSKNIAKTNIDDVIGGVR